jgi:hypothetical protein
VDPKHYLFVDQRMLGRCAYCGGTPDTRDHVPSKVLLDDPLPANLPIVEACAACNRGFSLEEEYLACFLECVLVGSSDVELVRRPKVKRALSHNKRLAKRIQSAARLDENGVCVWTPESDRVRNVVVKLGRGHVAYELSLTQLDEPREVFFLPRSAMSASENKVFERAGAVGFRGWPEVNSRAFLRACGAEPYVGQRGPWIVVQSGQYRYAVDQHGGVRVQIVLAEYLACVVDWE